MNVLNPTPLLLTVLSLLYEEPMHPYQMQRLIRERDKEFVVTIKPGSIYHAVSRLVRAGLAEEVETSRSGRRPERTTYRITDVGRETCEEWVRTMVSRPKQEKPEFAAAMAFLPILPPDEAATELRTRASRLEAEIAAHDASMREVASWLPRVLMLEVEYVRAMRAAELTWVRSVAEDLKKRELTWSKEDFERVAAEYRGGAMS